MRGEQRHQELVYQAGHDYRGESPHLRHHRLNESLREQLRRGLHDVRRRCLPADLLEIGAGDGAFVEPALAYGARVTATEMSRPSIARLEELYGANPAFAVHFDPDGSLDVLEGGRFAVVLFASVLHHIPDYLEAIRRALTYLHPGGCLISLQDPLWYPTLPPGVRSIDDAAFLAWRVAQGNLVRGVHTRLRRLRGVHDDDNPADVVEYHAVRQGVDQESIRELLTTRFNRVEVVTYWSTQAPALQALGERLPLRNTFAIVATGYEGVGFGG